MAILKTMPKEDHHRSFAKRPNELQFLQEQFSNSGIQEEKRASPRSQSLLRRQDIISLQGLQNQILQ